MKSPLPPMNVFSGRLSPGRLGIKRRERAELVAFIAQFARFVVVGTTGFLVCTAVIYMTRGAIGPALAAAPAFLISVTVTWLLNRRWTFKYQGQDGMVRQWLLYIVWKAPVLLIDVTTYELLILNSRFIHDHPVVGSTSGAMAGMFVSFAVLRRFVFRKLDTAPGLQGAGQRPQEARDLGNGETSDAPDLPKIALPSR